MQKFYQAFKKAVTSAAEAVDVIAGQSSAICKTHDSLTARFYPKYEARDTIIVQDISGSMADHDYKPSRLDGGLKAAIDYYNARKKQHVDDRIAFVAFNHKARVIVPLSGLDDEPKFRAALQKLTADGGTDIAKGLQAAAGLFGKSSESQRCRHVILLSDGHGGKPFTISEKLKNRYCARIDVIGIGGTPSAVNESLLRQVASTDPDGTNHYRFIKDAESLQEHYQQLATGLMWRGGKS